MRKELYLSGLDGEKEKLNAILNGPDYKRLKEFSKKHYGKLLDKDLIIEAAMKKVGIYFPLLVGDRKALKEFKHNKKLGAKINRISLEIAIAKMYSYERHKDRAKHIAEYILADHNHNHYSRFYCPNQWGDPIETVYEREGCHINYCERYEYMDIIGLMIFEQEEVEKLIEEGQKCQRKSKN